MTQPLKTLIAEDNPNDAELLLLELERGGFQVEAAVVDTAQAFQNALKKWHWDVIFSDHTMPHFSSFEALDIRNRTGLDTPFVILSGTMGEDLAVEAMQAGASDYFVKGKLTRLVAAVKRELQEAQEREKRRSTEQELEHFVASLTHDLRTPILAEQRILEQFVSQAFGPVNPEQREILEEMLQSNQFIQYMVSNILFAYKYRQRQVHLSKEPTNLAQFVSAFASSIIIQTLMKEKTHELIIEPVEALPLVQVDQKEMQRVFLNLVKNAVDYTPSGGTIAIAMSWQGERVRITVRDTGPGVDPEIEPYLFTPYSTESARKYRQVGMGLGLYLSKQIIEAHGGRIGYQRQPDGSLFYFELPVRHQSPDKPAERDGQAS
ncbi:MAG TPA: ATP-binding protein [Coleofasciculaceae cyanobacterium]